MNQSALREVALYMSVSGPYYLSQEMARWADVVVADYNYYFDFSALLFGLAQANNWKVAVLVDEVHNLVERGGKCTVPASTSTPPTRCARPPLKR